MSTTLEDKNEHIEDTEEIDEYEKCIAKRVEENDEYVKHMFDKIVDKIKSIDTRLSELENWKNDIDKMDPNDILCGVLEYYADKVDAILEEHENSKHFQGYLKSLNNDFINYIDDLVDVVAELSEGIDVNEDDLENIINEWTYNNDCYTEFLTNNSNVVNEINNDIKSYCKKYKIPNYRHVDFKLLISTFNSIIQYK